MHNYEHEIEVPQDKAIVRFLWSDFFHDSRLEQVDFDDHTRIVTMTLACERDGRDYSLLFRGVRYFTLENKMDGWKEYLNGRFKDTALLRSLQTQLKRIYHFRIQLDSGLCDIIFQRFLIRKVQGHIVYPKDPCDSATTKPVAPSAEQILTWLSQARNEDDFDRFFAMTKLYEAGSAHLLSIARENLLTEADEYQDSKACAAYLLGKLGDRSDLSALERFYFELMDRHTHQKEYSFLPLMTKNTLDAIALIRQRCGQA